ncbi:lamin tail domain-containing protein [Euzebyella marina]|uniref:Lamin tail domain-containing protein n=1 Tax=Euzebyella marina TaxID=1761453 RepID=A0A3G2LB68_9FLAO|nr:DUF5689 domain-containing protein [Euzebyella marina]AYN69494.1 lamin tail domain-containing protein [Euzebyella marina]
MNLLSKYITYDLFAPIIRASILLGILIVFVLNFACNREFENPSDFCRENLSANISYLELMSLHEGETFQIQDDLIIEGYVISSDRDNNFFSVIYFQDRSTNPTAGLQIEIDLRESHLFYPVGSKIFIKLKGLYFGKSNEQYKLGATFESFGNTSVGRLPAGVIDDYLFKSCDAPAEINPVIISVADIEEAPLGTLVRFDRVEFLENEVGEPFAIREEETVRNLIDCNDEDLKILNSGYSDFQSEVIPNESGSLTGVLISDRSNRYLVIRDLNDLSFTNDRCEELIDEFTSDQLFISELADPDNNSGARFVELYYSGSETLSLKGWSLVRYTNANSDLSSIIDLSDYYIEPESTMVISPNATEFEIVYGFPADISVGTNTPADSNGDDNLQLIDPFGNVIDTFGRIGEDGSGTDHEFEDGRAVRLPEVLRANSNFNAAEWQIFNDTGDSGTINQPQIAPSDFSPGIRD